MNYYETLGLNRNATQEEISRAFRKLALQYHPDKTKDNKTTERFRKISEAYDTLKDTEKRRVYDMMHDIPISLENKSFDELMKTIFCFLMKFLKKDQNINTGEKDTGEKYKKKNIILNIDITLQEIHKGDIKKLSIQTKSYDGKRFTKNIFIPMTNIQDTYIFENEGDEYSKDLFGDIIVHVKIKDDSYIKRDTILCPYDLYIDENMTLYEYYTGIQRTLFIFDKKIDINIDIKNHKYQDVLGHFVSHILYDNGLPFYNDDDTVKRGNITIYFKLKLPENIDINILEYFKKD